MTTFKFKVCIGGPRTEVYLERVAAGVVVESTFVRGNRAGTTTFSELIASLRMSARMSRRARANGWG